MWCQTTGRACLEDHDGWKAILAGWDRPHEQHDVAEFCTRLMENVPMPVFAGEWRKWEADAITDRGDLSISSILLHIGRHKSVQSMVQAWQKQEQGMQALVNPPHGLILQLSRFSQQSHRIRKLTTSVILNRAVCITCWNHASSELSTTHYRLVGVIYHMGTQVKSGHYRLGLFAPGTDSATAIHVTDDSQPDCQATPSDLETMTRNSYILFYVMQPS